MLTLATVQQECNDCRACSLHTGRTNTVFGEGNPLSRFVLVGEGPGQDEDQTGRPFVGRAGILLRTTLHYLGIDPTVDLYITNIVKCRPPGNRVPEREEIEACTPYLDQQLRLIKPRVIVTLGKTATDAFLLTNKTPMGALRGKVTKVGITAVLPTFHPSYLARQTGIGLNVKGTTYTKRVLELLKEHHGQPNTPLGQFIQDIAEAQRLLKEAVYGSISDGSNNHSKAR
jgi:uracil-DNA glycosylase family 4